MGKVTGSTWLAVAILLFCFVIMVMSTVAATSIDDLTCCKKKGGTEDDRKKCKNVWNSSMAAAILTGIVVILTIIILVGTFRTEIKTGATAAYGMAQEYGPRVAEAIQEAAQKGYEAGISAAQQME